MGICSDNNRFDQRTALRAGKARFCNHLCLSGIFFRCNQVGIDNGNRSPSPTNIFNMLKVYKNVLINHDGRVEMNEKFQQTFVTCLSDK